jgi:hypothetical protein
MNCGDGVASYWIPFYQILEDRGFSVLRSISGCKVLYTRPVRNRVAIG